MTRSRSRILQTLLFALALGPFQARAQGRAPEPCPPETFFNYVLPEQRLTAAFYYPWFDGVASCPTGGYWCDCFWQYKPGHPRPAAGFYDSSDRGVIGRHLDQMSQHNVDVVAVEWAAFRDEGLPSSGWDENLVNGVLPELESRDVSFVLLYDMAVRFPSPPGLNFDSEPVRSKLIADFQRFANDSAYFHHAKYLKLQNRPVVYLYVSRDVAGSVANIRSAFDAARAAWPSGLYLVADHLFYDGPGHVNTDTLEAMGASAVSAFAAISTPKAMEKGISDADPDNPPVRRWAEVMVDDLWLPTQQTLLESERRYDFTPGVFAQFDDAGFGPGEACSQNRVVQRYHLRSAGDWSYMIGHAGIAHQWIAQETRITPACNEVVTKNTDTSILWVYSYNEWGEGSGVEELDRSEAQPYPYAFGTELLATLREAVGGGGGGGNGEEPPAPTTRNPEGTVEGLRPVFMWDAVPFGDQYHLQVFDSVGAHVVDDDSVSDTSFIPAADLTNGEQHTWQVRGHNPEGWGPFSGAIAFTPQAPQTEPPDPPTALAPSGCTATVRPTFSWTAAARATDYKIAIYEVSPETRLVYEEVSGTSYVPSINLVSGRQHRWKVKSRNSQGEAWSDNIYFTPGCGRADIFWYEDGVIPAMGVFLSKEHSFEYDGNWGLVWLPLPSWAGGGDFNGDGKSDLFWKGEEGPEVYLSDGHQYVSQGSWGLLSWNAAWAAVGDFTGDGKDDVAWQEPGGEGGLKLLRSTGSHFFKSYGWFPEVVTTPTWTGAGDFNGDGKDDIFWYEDGVVPALGVFLSTGHSFVNSGNWGLYALAAPTWAGVGDFNGDGKADLFWKTPGSRKVFLSDGQHFVDDGAWGILAWNPTWAAVGDFTADGKDDIVWRNQDGALNVLRSTGTRFINSVGWYPPGLYVPTFTIIANYDGN